MEDLNQELEQAARLRQLRPQMQQPAMPDADYFAQMEASVFEKLKAEGALRVPSQAATQMSAKKGGMWRTWAVAASALVAVGLAGWWYVQQNTPTEQIAAADTQITTEDAEAWALDHIETFEPQELVVADILAETDAQPQQPNSNHEEPLVTPDDSDLLEGMTDEDLEDLL